MRVGVASLLVQQRPGIALALAGMGRPWLPYSKKFGQIPGYAALFSRSRHHCVAMGWG